MFSKLARYNGKTKNTTLAGKGRGYIDVSHHKSKKPFIGISREREREGGGGEGEGEREVQWIS